MRLQNTARAMSRRARRKFSTSGVIPTLHEAVNLAGRPRADGHHTSLSAPVREKLRGLPAGPGAYMRVRGMQRRSQVREVAR